MSAARFPANEQFLLWHFFPNPFHVGPRGRRGLVTALVLSPHSCWFSLAHGSGVPPMSPWVKPTQEGSWGQGVRSCQVPPAVAQPRGSNGGARLK